MKCSLLLHRHIRRTLQPSVLGSGQRQICVRSQLFVFMPSDLVHGRAQRLGDMKPVKADLQLCIGQTSFGRTDIGRPHVHAHTPNPFQLGGRQLPIPARKGCFIPPNSHIQHRSRVCIGYNREILVALLVPVHADVRNYPLGSARQSPLHRTLDDPIDRFPAKVQLPGNRQNARLLGPSNHKRLKVMRKSRTRIRPGNPDRLYPMLGTSDARNLGNDHGLILTRIQMTPRPSRTQIVKATHLVTCWTPQRRGIGAGYRHRSPFGFVVIRVFQDFPGPLKAQTLIYRGRWHAVIKISLKRRLQSP